MFCDLVGSTALSSRLDPEDLREIVAPYHSTVAEIVAGFDGFVSRYMGDGSLVYFGTRGRIGATPSGRSEQDWTRSPRSVASTFGPSSCKLASGSPPGSWSSAI